MGRITWSLQKPKPKYLHEAKVLHNGMKWETHHEELWAGVARIASYAGYRQRKPFWGITLVLFDTAEKADALRAWLRAEWFNEVWEVLPTTTARSLEDRDRGPVRDHRGPVDGATPGAAKDDRPHDDATASARVIGEESTRVRSVSRSPTATAAIVQKLRPAPAPGSGSFMLAITHFFDARRGREE
ncbi:MAG: hypothetical protein AAB403_10260 [Planctomycetota bacterium]